jgi:hypothetical protein
MGLLPLKCIINRTSWTPSTILWNACQNCYSSWRHQASVQFGIPSTVSWDATQIPEPEPWPCLHASLLFTCTSSFLSGPVPQLSAVFQSVTCYNHILTLGIANQSAERLPLRIVRPFFFFHFGGPIMLGARALGKADLSQIPDNLNITRYI